MSATFKVTHKAIGAEVRRAAYDVEVDGRPVGSVEMSNTLEIPVEPGRHTLQVRNGRRSSSRETFDATEGEVVAFRCTGKRFLPSFLASFVDPKLALKLVRGSVGPSRRGALQRRQARAARKCSGTLERRRTGRTFWDTRP